MTVSTELRYATLDELFLDPMNPRLGRHNISSDLSQDKVLDLMRDWTLEELAISYLESGGYWTHEALLVVEEKLNGKSRLVVIEGNRRLAALKLLYKAFNGDPISTKWKEIASSSKPSKTLFTKIPYLLVDKRQNVESFLGFRHVTGIKEWYPAEKAEFISHLIDDRGMTYDEVRRRIGSKAPTVRQNYIAYRLLLEIEEHVQAIPEQNFEERFSVLYLTLSEQGTQKYLQIDVQAEPKNARKPVPKSHLKALGNFALWLFGDDKRPPLFSDSRDVRKFCRILESPETVKYLERTDNPNFEIASSLAGGDEPEIVDLIEKASDNIELALTRVHHYKKSKEVKKAMERFQKDAEQIIKIILPSVTEH